MKDNECGAPVKNKRTFFCDTHSKKIDAWPKFHQSMSLNGLVYQQQLKG